MTRYDAIRRAIAHALNPKVLDLTKMQEKVLGRDDPVAEHVTQSQWSEIVAAFCDAPELGRILYRVKYAQERPDIPMLLRAGRLLADELNGKNFARAPSAMFLKMTRQAFLEYVHDECPRCTGGRLWGRDALCFTCGGVGRVPKEALEVAGRFFSQEDGPVALHVRCPDCRGAGRVPLDEAPSKPASGACGICLGTLERQLTDHQRARQLGLSIEAFFGKSWCQRYEDALDRLVDLDAEVADTIDRKLRRGHAVAAQSGAPAVST